MRKGHIFLLISVGVVIIIFSLGFLKLNLGITGRAVGVVSFSIVNEVSQETITTVPGIPKSINATSKSDITLLTDSGVTGEVSVEEYRVNPEEDKVGFAETGLRFISIEVNSSILSVLNSAIIYIYYTDEEISDLGLDESTLQIYWYNSSSKSWKIESDTGVNITGNYVWANVTHFSFFGVGGSSPESPSPTPSESGSESNGGSGIIEEAEEEIEEIGERLPSQLFDISLSLEDSLIQSSDELAARVSFENFGTEPIPVNITYIIFDELGNEVYSKEDYLIVYTEEFIELDFSGLDLELGKYTLILTTLYNVDVKDEFKQEFEIREMGELAQLLNKYWLFIVIGFIGLFFIMGFILLIKKLVSKRENRGKGFLSKFKKKIRKNLKTIRGGKNEI